MREANEAPSTNTLVKVQRVTFDVENRLTELVAHARMLKELQSDLKTFHSDTSALLEAMTDFMDLLSSLEDSGCENIDMADLEVLRQTFVIVSMLHSFDALFFFPFPIPIFLRQDIGK